MDDQELIQTTPSQPPAPPQSTAEQAGSVRKEQEPIPSPTTEPAAEYVLPSEAKPEIPEEAKEFVSASEPLAPVSQPIQHAGPFVPPIPIIEPAGEVKVPLSQEELSQAERSKDSSASVNWLVRLVKKILKTKGG